jgi:hypothetical protein
MADAELHIIVKDAGDVKQLAALLDAAMALKGAETRVVVPDGYRCVECFSNDGGHSSECRLGIVKAVS